ncbi:dNTP triphosphohydrolase [Rhizobium sp. CNPSo 4062]|uniref:deoxyguanosinetriphosphate triphosphohydrolase family protein n=1 Tax=Rhizobium sp. CNPSo 4062 TaxID=3021410 RepID=UPI0025516ACF|nr:dNTP triphosphohydrolase [Rhizobium sp. CNPSo 4062]MDK4704349.1 dNTP triphosphohydrolase [Rhizobium sp. CNPSo 4062]
MPGRTERFHNSTKTDQRNDFERDRDRILYSSAFHRLSGITQVVRAGEQEVFHTRQQHTIKVAQVGRRLAQRCVTDFPEITANLVDPEVVEAACLAHDLGHPPFGHVGEALLDELTQQYGEPDGFEGNAQTFRILTRLAIRFQEHGGLNLTRATLAATLKYPWLRDTTNPDRSKKWSAYKADADAFFFARASQSDGVRTTEAALMDWADDIAYSVHDLEDFHRCGAIPWIEVFAEEDQLVENALARWHGAPRGAKTALTSAVHRLKSFFFDTYLLFYERYEGRAQQRFELRNITSTLIGRFINAASVTKDGIVKISRNEQAEVLILKQIFRDIIIDSPTLRAQQHGQRRILADLYNVIYAESQGSYPVFLPIRLRYLWDLSDNSKARFTADCIASLTEREAVGMHSRLFGTSDSSVLDPIVR